MATTPSNEGPQGQHTPSYAGKGIMVKARAIEVAVRPILDSLLSADIRDFLHKEEAYQRRLEAAGQTCVPLWELIHQKLLCGECLTLFVGRFEPDIEHDQDPFLSFSDLLLTTVSVDTGGDEPSRDRSHAAAAVAVTAETERLRERIRELEAYIAALTQSVTAGSSAVKRSEPFADTPSVKFNLRRGDASTDTITTPSAPVKPTASVIWVWEQRLRRAFQKCIECAMSSEDKSDKAVANIIRDSVRWNVDKGVYMDVCTDFSVQYCKCIEKHGFRDRLETKKLQKMVVAVLNKAVNYPAAFQDRLDLEVSNADAKTPKQWFNVLFGSRLRDLYVAMIAVTGVGGSAKARRRDQHQSHDVREAASDGVAGVHGCFNCGGNHFKRNCPELASDDQHQLVRFGDRR